MIRVNEQRTKDGYEIAFFTDNKPLFRKARILLDKLSSKESRKSNSEEKTTAAAVVVYCKDCVFARKRYGKLECINGISYRNTYNDPNMFCSYRERKDEE